MSDHTTRPNESVKYLTKREQFAAMAIQGILADGTSDSHYSDLAKRAVKMADYLIEALNEEKK